MFRFFVVVVSIFAAILVASPIQAAPFVSINGYQIEPPTGWVPAPTSGNIDSMFASPVQTALPPSISVGVIRIPDNGSGDDPLKQFRDSVLESEKSIPGFTVLTSGNTTLDGVTAFQTIATFKSSADGPVLKMHQYYVYRLKLGYVVTCTALLTDFDSVERNFNQSIASFAFSIGDGKPITSPEGYTIVPPKDWAIKADPEAHGAYFIELGDTDFIANISIKSESLSKPVTADQIYQGRADLVKQVTDGMGDPRTLDEEMTTVAGENGVTIEVSFAPPNVAFRLWRNDIYVVHEQRLYHITMMSKVSDRARCADILSSALATWKWVKPSVDTTPPAPTPASSPTSASPGT